MQEDRAAGNNNNNHIICIHVHMYVCLCPIDLLISIPGSNDIPPYGSLALRDASGRFGSRGTLLVYTGEFFQPVCEANFDQTLGEVACRQLGYTRLEGIHLATR